MAELGKKYKCYKCGCKFYDLNKKDPVCPKCGEDQTNEETKKMLKRKRRKVLSKNKSDAAPVAENTESSSGPEDDTEEYVLDMEDIVLEENVE